MPITQRAQKSEQHNGPRLPSSIVDTRVLKYSTHRQRKKRWKCRIFCEQFPQRMNKKKGNFRFLRLSNPTRVCVCVCWRLRVNNTQMQHRWNKNWYSITMSLFKCGDLQPLTAIIQLVYFVKRIEMDNTIHHLVLRLFGLLDAK